MQRGSSRRGFTLLELIAVIAILGLLTTLAIPEYARFVERARSTACMGNLRALGAALIAYTGENDGRFPYINNPPPFEVYEEDDGLPADVEVQTLLEALGPYDIGEKMLRCPSDGPPTDYFATHGTSYEWVPRIDGEQSVAPKVLSRRGAITTRRPSRLTVLRDFEPFHFGRSNRLFADGSVRWYQH